MTAGSIQIAVGLSPRICAIALNNFLLLNELARYKLARYSNF
jgi:hypothetical protein